VLTYVLDASAYIRFLDRDAGGDRVAVILDQQSQETARIIISAIQWGEIVKIVTKRKGPVTIVRLERDLQKLGVKIIPVDARRAERSALLGLKYNISYADAFGVQLATDSPDHVLVTADYGVKPAGHDIKIEFLPAKPKP
jgi:predicted nucleic acid-binding protein